MKTEKQKLKRVSFTMRPEYIHKLSKLAENNSGVSLSHEVRRLIDEEWKRQQIKSDKSEQWMASNR